MVLAWEKGAEALKQLKQRWYENPNIAHVTVELIVCASQQHCYSRVGIQILFFGRVSILHIPGQPASTQALDLQGVTHAETCV